MTLVTGRISRIGSASGAQPQGRVWVMTDETSQVESAPIQVDTSAGSARWDLAINAFLQSRPVEIDVLATSNPMVADKVRITS